jgi:hypothetical protein
LRVLKLAAGLLFALLGSTLEGPEMAERVEPGLAERIEARTAASGRRGHAICGPDFYVWEETQREAEEWARELAAAPRLRATRDT